MSRQWPHMKSVAVHGVYTSSSSCIIVGYERDFPDFVLEAILITNKTEQTNRLSDSESNWHGINQNIKHTCRMALW